MLIFRNYIFFLMYTDFFFVCVQLVINKNKINKKKINHSCIISFFQIVLVDIFSQPFLTLKICPFHFFPFPEIKEKKKK